VKTRYRIITEPGPCGYLPDQRSRMEYERVERVTAEEYSGRLLDGWRRFGRNLFRPRCESCRACRSLRVDVAAFRPDRSQRRAGRAAEAAGVALEVGEPGLSVDRIDLYNRYHRFQEAAKGWPTHEPDDLAGYLDSFVDNPFRTEEWRYTIDGALVGLGFVDALPVGLSAIYFVHEPECRRLSLGTVNVLRLLAESARRGFPYLYLGYHVEGCGSLSYKARFRPCEVRGEDGAWRPFGD
jgi:arginine-tRNA-protein transferase